MSTSLEALRRDERLLVNREFGSVDEFIVEYVTNVSRSGVFVRSHDPLPVGTKVALRFTVLLDELETIEGVGRVVRVVPPGGSEPAGMGVVFEQLSKHSETLLARLLTRRD